MARKEGNLAAPRSLLVGSGGADGAPKGVPRSCVWGDMSSGIAYRPDPPMRFRSCWLPKVQLRPLGGEHEDA